MGVNNDPEAITVHCNSGALQLDSQENVISESDELMASKTVHECSYLMAHAAFIFFQQESLSVVEVWKRP